MKLRSAIQLRMFPLDELELQWGETSFWRRPPKVKGVYVIYLPPNEVVYVGKGNVRNRIYSHRRSTSKVMKAVPNRLDQYELRVRWAGVSIDHQNGVEAWLAQRLQPLAGEVWHNDEPIKVNLPWDKRVSGLSLSTR